MSSVINDIKAKYPSLKVINVTESDVNDIIILTHFSEEDIDTINDDNEINNDIITLKKYSLVDAKTNNIIITTRFKTINKFSDGYYLVQSIFDTYHFLTLDQLLKNDFGDTVQYKYACSFINGKSVVQLKKYYYFIDTNFNKIEKDRVYIGARPFFEGYAAVLPTFGSLTYIRLSDMKLLSDIDEKYLFTNKCDDFKLINGIPMAIIYKENTYNINGKSSHIYLNGIDLSFNVLCDGRFITIEELYNTFITRMVATNIIKVLNLDIYDLI